MSILLWKGFKNLIAALFSLVLLLGVGVGNSVKLSELEGRKTYYLYSASSQAVIKSSIGLGDMPFLKGECVEVDGVFRSKAEENAFVDKVLARYGAVVCFVEKVQGVVSYYAYSPELYAGVRLKGDEVNLHIAVSEGRAVVGSPIIFGGY